MVASPALVVWVVASPALAFWVVVVKLIVFVLVGDKWSEQLVGVVVVTAARCRRMGCNRLTGGVVVLVMTVAAAATAATTGMVVVAVVVVGVVTVALQSVSSMFMKDTAIALLGCDAGGVYLALTAVHDVKIPGVTHAKRPRTWDNVPSLSITFRSCNNTDKLPVTIYSHLYYNTLLSGLNHPIIINHKMNQKLLSGLNHLITSIKLIKRVKLVIHKTNQKC